MKYRRTPDGQFLLYSVGWDETDDGGRFSYPDGNSPRATGSGGSGLGSWKVDTEETGDWVWRYPTGRN